MYYVFFIIPLIIMVPILIYLLIWFCRFFTLFPRLATNPRRLLSAICTAICAYLCWPIYRTGGVFIAHFLAACLIWEMVNLAIRKKRNGEVPAAWSFLYRSGVLSVAAVTVIFTYGYWNMHVVHEKSYAITSSKVSADLRIGALSDLHLGTTMDTAQLSGYLQEIEAKEVDLFLLAGDIFDENTARQEMEKAAVFFGQMASTYGTYYVLGNHDPNHYVAEPNYTMEEMCQTLTAAGVHVLQDEVVKLDCLNIIGKKDASFAGRKETKGLAAQTDTSKFTLLLDHQPLGLQKNADAGIDLQISGHTHAGQIWPTGKLMELLGASEMNYGHKKIGGMDMIVTSGIAGWGYAIRTGGHCEYLVIDVKKT